MAPISIREGPPLADESGAGIACPLCPLPPVSSWSTASGVEPSTPSTQSSRTTTHSLSYDRGSFGSSTISGAYSPRSSWTPECGCSQYVPGSGTANRYVKSVAAPTARWVSPGTPSMSLRRASPCQWSEVGCGRWLARVRASVSPAVTRISCPGSRSPYAHELTVCPPPRSSRDGVAVRAALRSGPLPRRFSAAATSGPSGETYPSGTAVPEGAGWFMAEWSAVPPLSAQAVRTPVPARASEAPSTARRVC